MLAQHAVAIDLRQAILALWLLVFSIWVCLLLTAGNTQGTNAPLAATPATLAPSAKPGNDGGYSSDGSEAGMPPPLEPASDDEAAPSSRKRFRSAEDEPHSVNTRTASPAPRAAATDSRPALASHAEPRLESRAPTAASPAPLPSSASFHGVVEEDEDDVPPPRLVDGPQGERSSGKSKRAGFVWHGAQHRQSP
jgi:hypothetical protein